jgi:exosortase/archaeosortase family protein
MMYMFLGFVVAHAGPWRRKLWFIPVGLLLIHGSNILRIMALAEAVLYHPEIYEFNHKYAYTIVVYSLIIGLFALWHLRLSNPARSVWPKRVALS